MSFWVNISIICIIVAFILFIIALRFVQQKNLNIFNKKSEDNRALYTQEALLDFIKKRMTEITTVNLYSMNLTEDEFKRKARRREELREALKNCNTGDLSSKIYVREYIFELLQTEYGINEENIDWVIPYDSPAEMSVREKFETLLYLSGKKHGNKGFGYLAETYKLAEPKEDGSYRITILDVERMYKDVVRGRKVQFEDKLRVVTQIIYSQFKGFGIVDEIRDMAIDGVSGGVSGLPDRVNAMTHVPQMLEKAMEQKGTSLNSAWVMYKGKSIHLSFLSFGHESELRRVVTNIYKFGYPGQLSESRPYIINEMYDGSRVTVMRPKFSESWAFFIRKKFDAKLLTLEQLITAPRNVLAIDTLKYLMKGNRTCAVTGAQGSGKTTLLMAMIQHIHTALNLRIQETSFELNLRTLYPNRNILSFQETDLVSGQDGLDLQKKTDGDVTILGEVATDPVASWMIQSAQVASLFTLFTHHAKTFSNLVYALRNSLLKAGNFSSESIAEQQVVSVLEFDIHLTAEVDGTRYIERITECIPIEYEDEGLVMAALAKGQNTREEKIDTLLNLGTTFLRQQTQRKHFTSRNIIEYQNGEYVAVNPISEERQKEIMQRLTTDEREEFTQFINKYWGASA
ncbi:ATPase, T2SS/T4P/T4SS family [Solibacillus sp. NPDC093137]|uniref:ATPase, T2SS/T4P/T4SS family n=1 Tax=Solibacillus sp. NPDC093137 TaxID=3390678 RepID=UPI003D08D87A